MLITPDALQALELEKLLQHVEPRRCFDFCQHLISLRREPDRWPPAQAACLDFAVQVTEMRLRPEEPSEPFGPMFQFGDRRSALPGDFSKEMLVDIHPWASTLQDAELRARFLDVIWVGGKQFPAAKEAVTAYLISAEHLLHPEHWTDFADRLERAVRIAASLGRSGKELQDLALAKALSVVRQYGGADPLYLTKQLTQILLEFRFGDAVELAKYSAIAAQGAEGESNFRRASDYFGLAADCCRAAALADDEGAYRRAAAESLVKEADAVLGQPGRGAMAAASMLSSAVQAMRQAPGGKERADELGRRLIDLQEQAVTELESFSTSVDVTAEIQAASRRVSSKPFSDAVMAFCKLTRPPSLEALRSQVEQQARVAPLSHLMPTEVVNAQGRVVTKVPGFEGGMTDPAVPALRWRMFHCASMARSITAGVVIEPARKAILHEHAPARADVMSLTRHSPWIPEGHHESITRALVAGFHGDMLLAGHMVPMQLEAVIRQAVELAGGPGPMLKPDGTQEERTLAALLDSAEARHAFGAAGVFQLQDLLAEPLGSNLRNQVAHGLVPDGAFFSPDFLYAWWLLLRFVVVTAHIARTRAPATPGPQP